MDLFFAEEYETNLMLIEVPNHIVESLKKGDELIMKGDEQTILCTMDKSYELKYLETSNTFILMKDGALNERKEISLMVDHTLECQEYTPTKYTVINILREECCLTYDRVSGLNNFDQFKNKYTIEKLFAMSELCTNEFYKMKEEFGIFEKLGYACVFDESFLFSILFDILSKISNGEIDYQRANLDKIFMMIKTSGNEKILNNLTIEEKQAILLTTFDTINEDDQMINNHYSLNVEKVKLYCAKNVFLETKESNFKLDEFVTLLKKMLILTLPNEMYYKFTLDNSEYLDNGADDNLFENFKDFDLRFLRNFCVIYFLKTQRDALIKYVNFTKLSEKFKERVNELFKIKEKWTLKELKTFLADLHINNVEEKLANFLRIIPETNPFDRSKQVNFLQLKYKLY